MKDKIGQFCTKSIAMILSVCMIVGCFPMVAFASDFKKSNVFTKDFTEDEKPLVLSFGDSMTNGYGQEGYEAHKEGDTRTDAEGGGIQVNGFRQNDVVSTYPYYLAKYIAEQRSGKTFKEGDPKVWNYVDWEALAISCMRPEDMNFLLRFDLDNDLWKEVIEAFENYGNRSKATWIGIPTEGYFYEKFQGMSLQEVWEQTFKDENGNVIGDFFTWNEFVGNRFKDYSKVEKTEKYTYKEKEVIYKWEDEPTISYAKFFQNMVEDGDVFALGIGDAAFGVILLQNMMGLLGVSDYKFNGYFDIDGLVERRMPESLKEVTKMLLSKLDELATEKLQGALGDKVGKVGDILDVLEFTTLSFMIAYKDFLFAVDKLNKETSIDVVMLGLMNTTNDITIQLPGMDPVNLEEVLDVVMDILSEYEIYMPVLLQLEGKLSKMNFYYAPNTRINLLSDDMADLKKLHEPGYAIVRDRMVEDIKNSVFPNMVKAIDDAFKDFGIGLSTSNIGSKASEVIIPYEDLRTAFETWSKENNYSGAFDPTLGGTNGLVLNMSNVLAAGIYIAFERGVSASASKMVIDESLTAALTGEGGALDSVFAPVVAALNMETLTETVTAAVAKYLLAKLNATEEVAQLKTPEIVDGIETALKNIKDNGLKDLLKDLVAGYNALKASPIVPVGNAWYTFDFESIAEAYEAFSTKLPAALAIIQDCIGKGAITGNTKEINDSISATIEALKAILGEDHDAVIAYTNLLGYEYVPNNPYFLDTGVSDLAEALAPIQSFAAAAGSFSKAVSDIQGTDEFNFVSIFTLINALSDALGNALASDDPAMAPLKAIFALFARFLIGNGIGSHPNKEGHEAIFETIKEVYPNKPVIESLKDSLIDKGLMLGLINDDNKLIYRENLGKLLDLFFDFSKKTEEEAIEYVSYLVNAWLSENGDKILPAIRAYAIEKGYVNADTINALDAKIGAVISAVKTGNSADIFASVTDLVKYLFTLYKENEELVDNAKSFASDFIDLIAKVLIPRNIKSIENYVSIGASNVNGYGLEGYFQLDNESDYDRLAYDYKIKSKCNVLGYLQTPEKSYPVLLQKALSALQGNEVNLTQLAISSMRAEELRILLDDSYMGDSYSAWRFTGKNNWFDIADGVSDGDISGLRRSYQESIKNADLITVDIGANNFGVYLSQQLSTNFALDKDILLIDANMGYMYNNAKAAVEEALAPYKEYIDISSYSGLVDSIVYALVGFCYNFNKSIEKIYELNPDATVVVVGIQNLLEGLKANVYGFELPLGDVIGAIIDLANMYIQYGTIYAVKYLYANPAGSEGRVEFFLDEIAAYNGDVNSLSQDMINCFDIFDGNPGVRYNKGVHIQFQVLKAIAAKSNPILEEAFKNPEFEYTEEVYNQAMAVFAELLVNSETKDLASAAITAAYSAYASMLKTAAVVDVVDYSVLGNPDVEDVLSEGIANELVKAVEAASKGESYTFDETEFYNGLSNVSGISVDTLKGAAALAVRVSLGNSFFAHPNENGHKTIADSILQALKGTTDVDNFYITVLGLAEKYKTELPKYIKDYVLSMGVVNEAEYDAYLAELCELLVSFGHSEVLALLKGEIGLYEAYGKEIEEVKESLKALLKGNPEKVISLLNAVIDNIPFVSAQAKEQLKGYIAEYEKQYLALYAEYGKYLDKQYLESYAKALAEEFVEKLCHEIDSTLDLEPGASLAMVYGIIAELEAGAKITDIVNGYIDQITNYVVKEGKEQEAKLLAAIRKFLADNNISDEDLAVFDAYAKEVYDAINNAAPAVKEALNKAFAFVYEIVSDENLDFVRLADYLVTEGNATAAKLYDLILNAKNDVKDQSVKFYAGMVKAVLAELSKLGLDAKGVVSYTKAMLNSLYDNLLTPDFVKETLKKIEASVLSMLKPDVDKILYQIESYLRDNGASEVELAKYIAVKDQLLAAFDVDKLNAEKLLDVLLELTIQIIKEDRIEVEGLLDYIENSGIEFANDIKAQILSLKDLLFVTAKEDAVRIVKYIADELYKGFTDSEKIHYVVDKVLTMLTKKEGTLDSIEECISKISSYVSDKNFVQNLVNDIKELTVNYGPEYLEKVFEYALAKGILPKEAKELTDDVVELTKALRAGNEDYVEVLSFALVNRLSVYVMAAVNEFRDTHTYADVENAIFNAAKTIAEVESDPETLVKMLATIIKESYMYYGKEGLDFVVNFLADYVPEFAKAKFNEAVIVVYEKLEKSEEGFEEAFYAKFLELSGLNEENLTVIAGILDGIKDVAAYVADLYEKNIPQSIRAKLVAEIAKLPIREALALIKGEASLYELFGAQIDELTNTLKAYIASGKEKAIESIKAAILYAPYLPKEAKAFLMLCIEDYEAAYDEIMKEYDRITSKEYIDALTKELTVKLTDYICAQLDKLGLDSQVCLSYVLAIVKDLENGKTVKEILDAYIDEISKQIIKLGKEEQAKLYDLVKAFLESYKITEEELAMYAELVSKALNAGFMAAKEPARQIVQFVYELVLDENLDFIRLANVIKAQSEESFGKIAGLILNCKNEIAQRVMQTSLFVFEELFAFYDVCLGNEKSVYEAIKESYEQIYQAITCKAVIEELKLKLAKSVKTVLNTDYEVVLAQLESFLNDNGLSEKEHSKYKEIVARLKLAIMTDALNAEAICLELVDFVESIILSNSLDAVALIDALTIESIDLANDIKDDVLKLKDCYKIATEDGTKLAMYVMSELLDGVKDPAKIKYVANKALKAFNAGFTVEAIEKFVADVSDYLRDDDLIAKLCAHFINLVKTYGPDYLVKVFKFALAKGLLPKEAELFSEDVENLANAIKLGNENSYKLIALGFATKLAPIVKKAALEYAKTLSVEDIENAIYSSAKFISEAEIDPEALVLTFASTIKEMYLASKDEGIKFVANFFAPYIPKAYMAEFNSLVNELVSALSKPTENFEEVVLNAASKFYKKVLALANITDEDIAVAAGVIEAIKNAAGYIKTLYEAGIPQNIRIKVMNEVSKLPIAEAIKLLKGETTLCELYKDEIEEFTSVLKAFINDGYEQALAKLDEVISKANFISAEGKKYIESVINEFKAEYARIMAIYDEVTSKEFIDAKEKELAHKLIDFVATELDKAGLDTKTVFAVVKAISNDLKSGKTACDIAKAYLEDISEVIASMAKTEQEKLFMLAEEYLAEHYLTVNDLEKYASLVKKVYDANEENLKLAVNELVNFVYELVLDENLDFVRLAKFAHEAGIKDAEKIYAKAVELQEAIKANTISLYVSAISSVFDAFTKFKLDSAEFAAKLENLVSNLYEELLSPELIEAKLDKITESVMNLLYTDYEVVLNQLESYLVDNGLSEKEHEKYKAVVLELETAILTDSKASLALAKELVLFVKAFAKEQQISAEELLLGLEIKGLVFADTVKADILDFAAFSSYTITNDGAYIASYVVTELMKGINDPEKQLYVLNKVLVNFTGRSLDEIKTLVSEISVYVTGGGLVADLTEQIITLAETYGPEIVGKLVSYAVANGLITDEAIKLKDDAVLLAKALQGADYETALYIALPYAITLSDYVKDGLYRLATTYSHEDLENAIKEAARFIADVELDPQVLSKTLAKALVESFKYYGEEGVSFIADKLEYYVPEMLVEDYQKNVYELIVLLNNAGDMLEVEIVESCRVLVAHMLDEMGITKEDLAMVCGIVNAIKETADYIASLYEAGIPQDIRSKVMAEIAKLPIAEVMALVKGEATIMDIYGDEILAVKEMIQNYILSEGLKAANYLKGVVSEAKLISENVKAMICGYIDEYVKAYNEAINIFGTITNKEFINEKAKELADKLAACLYDELSKYGINAVEYIAIAKTIVSELKNLDSKAVLDEHLDKLAAYVLEELTKEQEKLINVIRAHIASKLSPVCEEIREYNELANRLLEAIGKDAKHAKAYAKAFVAYLYNLAEEGKLNAEELLSELRACGISKALEIQNEVLAIKEILQTKVETQITKVLSAVFEEFAKFGIAKDEATEMITQFISKISKLIQGSSGIKDILDEITLGVRTIVIENGASFLDAVESYLVVTIGISNEQIAKYKMISDAILDALNNNKDSLLDICKEFVSYLYELSSMVHFDFNGLTAWLEELGFNFEDELKAKFTKLACQVIANVKLEALSIYQELLDTAKAQGVDVETIVGIINSVIGDINNCVSSFDLANMYLEKIAELLVDQVASTKENVLNMICAYLEKYCQIAKSELDILKDLAEKLIVAVSNQADEAKDISQQIVAYIYQLVELGKLDAMNLISYLEKEGLELSEEVTSLVEAAIACLESNVIGALKELTNNVLVKFDQIKDSSKLLANIINEMIVSIKQGKDVKDIIQDAIADIAKDIKAIVLETGSLYLEKINSLLLEKGLIVKAEADKLKALTDELVKAVMTNAKNAEALCKEYVTCVYNSLTYSRALVLSLIENVKLEAIAYLSESEKEAVSLIAALKQKVNELSIKVNDKLSEISLEISLRLAFAQFTFIECEELNYVVIGSNTVRANGLERTEKAYYDLFAEKYEAESIDVISKANLTPWEVADMIIGNASTIAKANLITYQFDLESFIYAYLAQNIEWADHIDANTLRIIDLVMDSLEKVLEDDWTSYMTLDAKEFEEKLYDEVLGLWTTKMPELVNEFVKLGREQVVEILEKGITLVRMTLAQAEQQKLELFKAASKSTREALYRMVRKTLYITTAYAIETVKVVETIKAINPDAELVIIGMYNQLEGISLKNGEDTIEIGSYINYLVDALNMTYLAYAAYREDITFIDIAGTSCDGLNLVVDLENLDPLALISSLLNLTANISANANGHKYIYEQLLANVLVDKQGSDEPEPEVVLGDVNEDGYIDSIDAMLVLRYDAQLIDITDINALNADVNDDGFIDSIDAMLILRYDAQLIDSFSSSN